MSRENAPSSGGVGKLITQLSQQRAARLRNTTSVVAMAAGALCLIGSSFGPAQAINLNDPQAAAVGGIPGWYDTGNAYPNVVSLFDPVQNRSECTGTLINSRTILTAAHCMLDNSSDDDDDRRAPAVGQTKQLSPTPNFPNWLIRFSPNAFDANPSNRPISGAAANPAFGSATILTSFANDIALVSLAQPVDLVAPVMLIQPGQTQPPPGTVVRIVGYGAAGTGSRPNAVSDSRRRAAETNIGTYQSSDDGRQLIVVQFRNPDDPSINTFGLAVPIPQLQAQPGPGDSGGPMFMVAPDGSLVQIGTVRGGGDGYAAIDQYVSVLAQWQWLAANNPLRETAAAAGSWAWSNPSAWQDSLGRNEVPNNAQGNFQGFGTVGRYYDVALTNASQITVDMSPTIDTLSISNAAAALNIPQASRLAAVVGTEVSAGLMTVNGTLDSRVLTMTGGAMNGAGAIVTRLGFSQSGGVLAPGNPNALGTLSITGDYTQGPGATLAIRVDAAGSDQLAVSGKAGLAGALALSMFQRAPAAGQTFTVATAAGGISGGFSQVSASLPAFTWTATVVGGSVVVKAGVDYTDDVPVAPSTNPDAQPAKQAANAIAKTLTEIAARVPAAQAQQAAAAAQIGDVHVPTTQAGAIASLNTLDQTALGIALETLPPVGFYGQTAFALQTSRLVSGVLTDRLNELDGQGAIQRNGLNAAQNGSIDAQSAPFIAAYAETQASRSRTMPFAGLAGRYGAVAPAEPATAATPFGLFVAGTWMTSGAAADTSFTTAGLTAGLDYKAAPGITFGAALTYVDDQRSAAGSRFDGQAVVPTLYGRFSSGRLFIDAYLGYGFSEMESRRLVILGDEAINVQAKPKAGQVLAGAVAGVRLDAATLGLGAAPLLASMTVTPFIGLDVTQVRVDSYAEVGAGALAIGLAERRLAEARGTAGLDVAWLLPLGSTILTPRLKASVTQRFGDLADEATAAFVTAPDLPFQLSGPTGSRTYGSIGGALGVQAGEAISALVSYQADVDHSGVLDNRIVAKLQYRF